MAEKNWAGNLQYRSPQFFEPKSIADAQDIVARSDSVRPLGTRHCFNRIADSEQVQISLRALDEIASIDEQAGTATMEAGASYGQVCEALDDRGYALQNLASLPHISIVGAAATGTHGSGADNQNMAAAVSGVELIDANGDLVTLTRQNDGWVFNGVPVHLGGLGLITKVKVDLVPSFEVRQHVYRDLPVSAIHPHFDEIMGSGYSVSLFTDYQGDTLNQVWRKQKAADSTDDPEPDFFGAVPADAKMHPVPGGNPKFCTEQFGQPGPWYNRLPHFRMGFTPSSGEELQTEYFVAREHSAEAYEAIAEWSDEIAPHLLISEVRLIDADDLWMSTAYGQPKTAFHFTWKQHPDALKRLIPKIEEALRPYDPHPHWGKVFSLSPETVQSKYDRLDDFKDLLARYDPSGTFRNAYLQYYLYGDEALTLDDMW
jgi:xylitol oxidase